MVPLSSTLTDKLDETSRLSGKNMTEAIEQEERDELRRKWKAEFNRQATEWC